jgi:RNA polymerase sigma-54 factor
MKQSLQLRMGQQLTMTVQLQQSIKLLQLSTLDLQQEIQEALESNMMLEVAEEDSNTDNSFEVSHNTNNDNIEESAISDHSNDIPEELPVDCDWDDIYQEALAHTATDNSSEFEFETQQSKTETLQDFLLEQLRLMNFSDKDYAIGLAIIDAINANGYLAMPLTMIHEDLSAQIPDLDFEEVLAVLHTIQYFEPAGVAAIDLKNCLQLQLQQLPNSTPYREVALELVEHYLDLLAAHDQEKLTRLLKINATQLEHSINLIRHLNPKPGAIFSSVEFQYIIPDVFVFKRHGQWQVELNPDIVPKLRINPFYANMIKRADNSLDNNSLKTHLKEAKWFIKSLHSRNDTLLQVAQSIVEKQQGFLEHGAIAMKAMVLKDIAEQLDLHESTISRLTTQKYMHTPNGIVEFKYFFSSHVSTAEGGECSATAIRAFIKQLISSESPAKPLTDDKIAVLLNEKGINVARRTIAKYREAMSIASSSQRKRLL